MFRISYTDPYQGMVIADYLIKKCGAKKLAILGDIGDAYGGPDGIRQEAGR